MIIIDETPSKSVNWNHQIDTVDGVPLLPAHDRVKHLSLTLGKIKKEN